MKLGDMVKNQFIDGIERYGVIVENASERYIGMLPESKKYFKVKYLPHPELPFNGGDMYHEYTCEEFLTVVSSV
jgi:hypothetical protein